MCKRVSTLSTTQFYIHVNHVLNVKSTPCVYSDQHLILCTLDVLHLCVTDVIQYGIIMPFKIFTLMQFQLFV